MPFLLMLGIIRTATIDPMFSDVLFRMILSCNVDYRFWSVPASCFQRWYSRAWPMPGAPAAAERLILTVARRFVLPWKAPTRAIARSAANSFAGPITLGMRTITSVRPRPTRPPVTASPDAGLGPAEWVTAPLLMARPISDPTRAPTRTKSICCTWVVSVPVAASRLVAAARSSIGSRGSKACQPGHPLRCTWHAMWQGSRIE